VTVHGVWIVWNRFSDHFTTRLGTTSNYSVIANLHTIQITAANTKFSPACSVFASRFLITVPNSWNSSDSVLTPFSAGHRLKTELSSGFLQLITPWHVPHRKNNPSIIAEACLPRRCVGMVAARTTENTDLLLLRALPSNCLQSHRVATDLYPTIHVCIATGYGVDGQESIPGKGKWFLCSRYRLD
jgi:hypothetical protein